jgi:hypothetical protein
MRSILVCACTRVVGDCTGRLGSVRPVGAACEPNIGVRFVSERGR